MKDKSTNQKMLLMRDTVVKQEADIRDLTSRLRIETNEHMKSEERGGKYQAEIKLQKQRLEAEQAEEGWEGCVRPAPSPCASTSGKDALPWCRCCSCCSCRSMSSLPMPFCRLMTGVVFAANA